MFWAKMVKMDLVEIVQGHKVKMIYLKYLLALVAKDAETGEILFEITEHEQTKILVEGEEVDWVMLILKPVPDKRLDLLNQANQVKKSGKF